MDRIPVEEPRSRLLFLHGITGNSGASPIPEAATLLAREGVEPWVLNLRGADRELPEIPRLYHAGCSEDLDSVFFQLPQDRPWRFVGFSLGANLLLKWLGEGGVELDGARAMAVSCPYDLAECAHNLESRFVHRIYRWAMIGRLRKFIDRFALAYPEVLGLETLKQCRTFYEFDEVVTARLHGFDGALDYWQRNSSSRFLSRVQVPTVLLHAQDDPFQPHPPSHIVGSFLSWELYPTGGHVGFQLGWRDDWLVERVVRFGGALRAGAPPDYWG